MYRLGLGGPEKAKRLMPGWRFHRLKETNLPAMNVIHCCGMSVADQTAAIAEAENLLNKIKAETTQCRVPAAK
jgi:hypothetical protein